MKTFLMNSIGILAVVASADLAQAACGKVEIAKGKIQVTTSAGKSSQASAGSSVCSGDTVTAGPDSRAKIKMEDGNELNVSPDSKIVLETYEYQPSENKKKVLLNVLKGKVRATTKEDNMYNGKGKDGQANFFQVKTKSAVAGVRGTDFLTSFNPATNKSEVVTFRGQVAFGPPGPGGQILNPVMVGAGQKTEMSPGQAPAPPKAVPAAELDSANRESRGEPSGPKNGGDARNDGSKSDEKKSEEKSAGDDKKAEGEPKSDDKKAAGEPKSDDKKAAGEPKSDDKKAASEPKSDDKKAASEPKSDDKKAASEPKSGDKQASAQPKSDDSKSAANSGGKTNEPKQAAGGDSKSSPTSGAANSSGGSTAASPGASDPKGSTTGSGQASNGAALPKSPNAAPSPNSPRAPTSIPSGSLLNDRDLGGGAGAIGSVPNLPKIPGSQFQVPVPTVPIVPICDQCNAARTNSRVNITIKY